MTHTEGIAFLNSIRRRRQWRGTWALALPALGLGLLAGAAAYRWLNGAWWPGIPAFLASWAMAVGWFKPYRVPAGGVARHLNALFPSLEESTHLLLKPAGDLSLLERMQTGRLLAALREIDARQAVRVPHRASLAALMVCAGAASAVRNGQTRNTASTPSRPAFRVSGSDRSPRTTSTASGRSAEAGLRTSALTFTPAPGNWDTI